MTRITLCIFTVLLCGAANLIASEEIPAGDIDVLVNKFEKDLSKARRDTDRRRVCKRAVRASIKLLEAFPKASNRYSVLDFLLRCQKKLLEVDQNDKNREALIQTCESLSKAPDEYVLPRLKADIILLERETSKENASSEKRVEGLQTLLLKYRGTPAEGKSLLAALFAIKNMDSPEFERTIYSYINEHFPHDTDIIQFRRQKFGPTRLDVVFKGTFNRIDGTEVRFPNDTMGHMSLMVFWSKHDNDEYLKKVNSYVVKHPGCFDVFSFNVDELPDGGSSVLHKYGFNWTVMHLSGGKKHPAYQAYARSDPVALLVNSYGFSAVTPEPHMDAVGWREVKLDVFGISDQRISSDRYLAQMQSLFIGDLLVQQPTESISAAEGFNDLEKLFVRPPFRYRLTREEALANYTVAEKTCNEFIKKNLEDTDLWQVHNRRIIALLGKWNLACEPKFLKQAVNEAKTVIKVTESPVASVIPRFCLAKNELRSGNTSADSIVSELVEACGGSDAPESALAAAVILALDARSRELFEKYRDRYLKEYGDEPILSAFNAYLRHPQHQFRVLMPNHGHRERWGRHHVVLFGRTPRTDHLPPLELKLLDGTTLSLPVTSADSMTALVFLEPPTDPIKNFPAVLDRNGKPNPREGFQGIVGNVMNLAEKHVNKELKVILAFLCDDSSRVSELMKSNGWKGTAAMVPGGISNPIVNRLGLLSPDKTPVIYLLRRDGSVVWSGGGLPYKEFTNPFVLMLGLKVHIEESELAFGYSMLEKGNYKRAAQVFSGPYLPWRPDRYHWRSPRYHGKSIALAAQKKLAPALEAVDIAIDAHKTRHHRYGRREGPKNIEEWREAILKEKVEQTCDIFAELQDLRAEILTGLGRPEEAKAALATLKRGELEEHDDHYSAFHNRLKAWRHKKR